MSFTYELSPLTSDLDAVRFIVGDTDATDQQLQDEEIAYLLATESGVRYAAAAAARAIGAKYRRQVDRNVGDLRISFSQKAAQYDTLYKQLRMAADMTVIPLIFSLSQSAKDAADTDPDLVKRFFSRTLMETPGSQPPGNPLVH